MGGLLASPKTAKRVEDGLGGPSRRWAYGVSDMQGWRPAMEDAHLALPDFDPERGLGLFGVFDGHGGGAVARVTADRLPGILRSQRAFVEGRYEQALGDAFLAMDNFLDGKEGRRLVAAAEEKNAKAAGVEAGAEEEDEEEEEAMPDAEEDEEEEEQEDEDDADEASRQCNNAWACGEGPDGMGTTAVVALVRQGAAGGGCELFVANAGDSRCLVARGETAVDMSRDHKPTNKEERQRIVKAGGFVTAEGRVDGNLNLSRAFADFAYKKDPALKQTEQKISCEAEVWRRALVDDDRYLVLGCDGIFEKFTNKALVNFLAPRLRESWEPFAERPGSAAKLSSVCSSFLDHNVAGHPIKEQGLGCDNMTLMVVDLAAAGAAAGAASRGAGQALGSRLRRGQKRRLPVLVTRRRRRLQALSRFTRHCRRRIGKASAA